MREASHDPFLSYFMLSCRHGQTLRLEFAGALCHVTSCGNGREPIYMDDRDRILLWCSLYDGEPRRKKVSSFRVKKAGLMLDCEASLFI